MDKSSGLTKPIDKSFINGWNIPAMSTWEKNLKYGKTSTILIDLMALWPAPNGVSLRLDK